MRKSKSIVILLVAAWAAWLFTDCRHGMHDDPRLVAIDSLLATAPDSALSRLDAIEASSLSSDADRAYHALLLTQARYRCYITATSDSDINLALAHYQRHSNDREKLTRAHVYKGAVAEELGDLEGAMHHFKEAAAIVPDEDEFLQGYIKLRIGNIYRNHQVADGSDVMMFKQALTHFKQVPDSFYILTCLSEIGSSYTKTNRDSVLPYLYQARAMAQQMNEDNLLLINDIWIAEFKAYGTDSAMINEAKNHALAQIQHPQDKDDMKDLLLIAALTLAKQNKPDSASLYLNRAESLLNLAADSVFYYRCQAEVARSRGDVMRYQFFAEKERHINDSLTTNALQFTLRDVEQKYDNEVLKNEKQRYRNMLTIAVIGGLLAISLLALALMAFRRKAQERQRRLQESQDRIDQLHAEADELASRLKANTQMSEGLKAAIRQQLDVFMQLVELHSAKQAKNPSKFNAAFEESYKGKKPDLPFWKSIKAYADSTHGGLISHLKETNEELIESDLRVLSLCCCHLPTSAIMACMGYNDVHSVYNKKKRIATILGLEGRLSAYVFAHETIPAYQAPPAEKISIEDLEEELFEEEFEEDLEEVADEVPAEVAEEELEKDSEEDLEEVTEEEPVKEGGGYLSESSDNSVV
ncbi:MAG: hypothetical protein IKX56_09500 [Muribaculaceae bacterium]|nr:hypothetical protein [Muribaculaceae bacterium]